VKLAHQAEAGDEPERDIPAVVPHERPAPRGFRPDRETGPPKRFSKGAVVGPAGPREQRRDRPQPTEEVAMLFVGAGREAGIRPGDLVGAITGEAGINSRELGAIQIADRFSLVEVRAEVAGDVIRALRGTTIMGRKVTVRKDFMQE
jgi:ATP-dependent RNA helicase DeaD